MSVGFCNWVRIRRHSRNSDYDHSRDVLNIVTDKTDFWKLKPVLFGEVPNRSGFVMATLIHICDF
jgi:hypothetical protein